MKKVNFKLFSLIFLLVAFCGANTFAQKETTKSKKKVVVVKKIKDKDGKVKVERIEKEGQEAEEYIKSLKIKDENGEEIDIDIRIDGDVMMDSDGENKRVEIIEIDDINELSDELKQELKDLNIEIDILDDVNSERIIKIQGLAEELEMIDMGELEMIMIPDGNDNIENLNINRNDDETTIEIETKDGEKKKFKYKGEMPDEIKKELEAMGLELGSNGFMHSPDNYKSMTVISSGNFNKASNANVWISSEDNYFTTKHQPSITVDSDNDNIETIDVQKDNDKTIVKIKEKGADTKTFEWEGEMPDDIKKELEKMDVKVSKGNFNPMGMGKRHKKMMIGGGNKAFLGVEMGDKKSDKGVLISKVVEESAAEKAGLKAGDIITAIDANEVKNFDDLVKALEDKKIDDNITIKYLRDNKANSTEATLTERKGFTWISEDGDEIKIKVDEDFDFDFDGSEIHEGDENVFLFRQANESSESRPFIGILMEGNDKTENGVKLLGTVGGSAAEKAGLKKGDIIMSVDGQAVKTIEDVTKAVEGKKVGDKIMVNYRTDMNDSKTESVEIELGERINSNTFTYEFNDNDFSRMKKKYKSKKIIIIKADGEKEEEEIIIRKSMSDEDLEEQRVKVFPNPTKDQLTVQFKAEGNPYTLIVQDISGKEIYREEVKDGIDYDKQLDISQAASGMVIVTINQGDDVYKMKVLKQ